MPRCPSKTHDGKRCKNPTQGHSKHCAVHSKRSNRGARRRQRQAFIGTLTRSRQGQLITNRRMSSQFKLKVPLTMKADSRKSAESLYVFPKQKIYPIGNLYHARKAINYVIGFPSTRSEAGDVVRAVVKAYPEYDWKAYWNSKVKKRKAGQKKLGSFNSYLKNPSGVHQALGAHASYGPEGLQTKQARLNPRRKMNRSKLPEVGKIYGSKGDYILVDAVYEPDRFYRSGYISYTGVGPQGVTAKTLIEKDRWSGQAQWERLLSPSPNEVGMMSGGMTGADWSRAGYRKANKLPIGWKKLYAGWRKKMKGNPRRRKNSRESWDNFIAKLARDAHSVTRIAGKWDLGYTPSVIKGNKIIKSGTIHISHELAKTPSKSYHYVMPIPRNATVNQLKNKLRDISGSWPVLGDKGELPSIKVSKSNPRRRKNASGAHGPLGQHAPFGPAGLVTKQGGLPAYGPWHRRKNGFVGSDAEAQELALYISNDGDLYRQQTTSIITNLAKKMAKRTFDRAKAVKLFKYLADNGAKKYSFDFGDRQPGVRSWHSYKGFGPFTPDIRRQAAAMLLEEYMEAIQYEADLIAAKSKKNPRRRNPRILSKGVRGMAQKKTRDLQRHVNYFFVLTFDNGKSEPVSMKAWLDAKAPVDGESKNMQEEMKRLLLHKAKKSMSFGRLMDFNNVRGFQSQIKWFYNNGVKLTKRGISSKSYDKRNPHCKPNPRNVKVDIDLPKTNLRVVGAGMDTNGNSVIRFAMGANRGFSIQVAAVNKRAFSQGWDDIMYSKMKSPMLRSKGSKGSILRSPAKFAKEAIDYIKAVGSPAQKKSLRVYKSNRR